VLLVCSSPVVKLIGVQALLETCLKRQGRTDRQGRRDSSVSRNNVKFADVERNKLAGFVLNAAGREPDSALDTGHRSMLLAKFGHRRSSPIPRWTYVTTLTPSPLLRRRSGRI
jgi:hypothetical protein